MRPERVQATAADMHMHVGTIPDRQNEVELKHVSLFSKMHLRKNRTVTAVQYKRSAPRA